jgi:hypothetical protein
LQRLPDRYRAPLVACFLQSRTQEDAAKEMGCSHSTLRRRLERDQELLRKRLTGRGAGPALAALTTGAGVANVSATLVETTTALVVAFVTGKAGPVPATGLAERVIATMAHTKFKALAAVLLVAGLVGVGVALRLDAAQPPQPAPVNPPADAKAPKPPEPPAKVGNPPPKDKEPKPAEDRIKPGDRLTVRVRNALETSPIDGPFEVEASGKLPLGPPYGRVKIDGLRLEEAEEVVLKHLKQMLRDPAVSIVRYSPPEGRALELRVRQLELEVKELRLIVEELRKKQ